MLGISDMVVDVFLPWSDVSVGWAFLTWLRDVFLLWSDISLEEDEDLHEGLAYIQHEKGLAL